MIIGAVEVNEAMYAMLSIKDENFALTNGLSKRAIAKALDCFDIKPIRICKQDFANSSTAEEIRKKASETQRFGKIVLDYIKRKQKTI